MSEQEMIPALAADVSPHLDSLGPLLGMDLASPEAAGLLRALCHDTGSSVPFTALLFWLQGVICSATGSPARN